MEEVGNVFFWRSVWLSSDHTAVGDVAPVGMTWPSLRGHEKDL